MERKQSVWIETWTELQALRCVRLLRMGRFAEPEVQPIAAMSAQLQRAAQTLLALAESDEGMDAAAVYLELAWVEFLRNEWAQSLTPAFPLHAFCNTTVLQKCWAAAEFRIAEEAELQRHEHKLNWDRDTSGDDPAEDFNRAVEMLKRGGG